MQIPPIAVSQENLLKQYEELYAQLLDLRVKPKSNVDLSLFAGRAQNFYEIFAIELLFKNCYEIFSKLQSYDFTHCDSAKLSVTVEDMSSVLLKLIAEKGQDDIQVKKIITDFINNMPLNAALQIQSPYVFQKFLNISLAMLEKIQDHNFRDELSKTLIRKIAEASYDELKEKSFKSIYVFLAYAKQIFAKNSNVKSDLSNYILNHVVESQFLRSVREFIAVAAVLRVLHPDDECCKTAIEKFAENANEEFFQEFIKYIPDVCMTMSVKEHIVKVYFEKYAIPNFEQTLKQNGSKIQCYDDYFLEAIENDSTVSREADVPTDYNAVSLALCKVWIDLKSFLDKFPCKDVNALYSGLKQLFSLVLTHCTKNKVFQGDGQTEIVKDYNNLDLSDIRNLFRLIKSDSCKEILQDEIFCKFLVQIITLCVNDVFSQIGSNTAARSSFSGVIEMLDSVSYMGSISQLVGHTDKYNSFVFDQIIARIFQLLQENTETNRFCKDLNIDDGKFNLAEVAGKLRSVQQRIQPSKLALFVEYDAAPERLEVARNLGRLAVKLEALDEVIKRPEPIVAAAV
jgi:hypothetical protein